MSLLYKPYSEMSREERVAAKALLDKAVDDGLAEGKTLAEIAAHLGVNIKRLRNAARRIGAAPQPSGRPNAKVKALEDRTGHPVSKLIGACIEKGIGRYNTAKRLGLSSSYVEYLRVKFDLPPFPSDGRGGFKEGMTHPNTRRYELLGEEKTAAEWGEELGVTYANFRYRWDKWGALRLEAALRAAREGT